MTTQDGMNDRETETQRSPRAAAPTLLLTATAMLAVHLWRNGYVCFRSDHQSQLPLLMMRLEPGLFARDWFFADYGPFDVRRLHLACLEIAWRTAGPALGTFGLFAGFGALLIGSMVWIARRQSGSLAAGAAAVWVAACFRGRELGANQVLENLLIPRFEAHACALAAWAVLLTGRGAAAGALTAAAGWFQPAVGLMWGPLLGVWPFIDRGRRGWPTALRFGVAWGALLASRLWGLRADFGVGEALLSDADRVLILAHLRNPHHMIPSTWGHDWLDAAGVALLLAAVWVPMRRRLSGLWRVGWMAWLAAAVPLGATLWIEIIPNAKVILLQPWRIAVLFYAAAWTVVGGAAVERFRRGRAADDLRGWTMLLAPSHWTWLVGCAVVEGGAAILERSPRWERAAARWACVGPIVVLAAAAALADTAQHPALSALALWGVGRAARRRGWATPRAARRLLQGVTAAGAVFVALGFVLPLERWVESDRPRLAREAAQWAWKYQFRPFPMTALERLGVWARAYAARRVLRRAARARSRWLPALVAAGRGVCR